MKYCAAAVVLSFIGIIIGADTGRLGFMNWIHRIPSADKVGHFLLYGILNLVVTLAAFEGRRAARRVWIATVCAAVAVAAATAEEVSQIHIASRTFSLLDLAAGLAGIACAAVLAVGIDRSRTTQSGTNQG